MTMPIQAPGAPRAARLALVACVVGMMSAMVSLFLGTFPLFLEPVSNDMHWSRATFPTVLMVMGLASALLGPMIGRLIDRVGARPTALAGILFWGAGLLGLSQIQPSKLLLAAVTVPLALGAGLAGQLVFARVISRWFTVNRGLAFGIALGSAPALSQAIAAPLVASIIQSHGWRTAYVALGLFVLLVTFTINALFLREPDGNMQQQGALEKASEGDTVLNALRSPRFWLLTLATALSSCAYNAIFQHSVAILGDKGVSSSVSTAFVSVVGLAGIASPLLAGAILDRVGHPRTIVLPFIACALAGSLLICNFHGDVPIVAGAVLCGISVGAGPVSQPFVLSRYFGLRAQSEILGLSLILVIAGSVAGPVLMGISFDQTGNYQGGMVAFELVAALATLLACLLPAYRHGAWQGDTALLDPHRVNA